MDLTERWLPIPGHEESYEVSDLGRIRALDRITDRGRKWKGQMMAPASMPAGYQTVTLWRDGKQKTALVHRLVLSAFIGPAPEGAEGLHGNGEPSDNSLSNLAWGTHSENQFDQVFHGTHANATKDACPSGHPYDDANTYFYPGKPHRACRECRRTYQRQYQRTLRMRAAELRNKEIAA